MLTVAATGVVCAVFTYFSVAMLMAFILPLIGAIPGVARSPRRLGAALDGLVICSAFQGGGVLIASRSGLPIWSIWLVAGVSVGFGSLFFILVGPSVKSH
ncbi:MAG: hypothetical protein ACLQGP_00625 [Isosphaeraceae bacterium]